MFGSILGYKLYIGNRYSLGRLFEDVLYIGILFEVCSIYSLMKFLGDVLYIEIFL